MKIFLIGMPGTGKSNVGQRLAQLLGLDFIDLDETIEAHENREIVQIFQSDGEAYFREVERSLLLSTSKGKAGFVMATGGGAPCFFKNMEFMNRHGITVFLDVPIPMIHQRLVKKGTESRPLLKDKQEQELLLDLQHKYNSRLFYYGQAHIHLEQEYGDIDQRAREIMAQLDELEK